MQNKRWKRKAKRLKGKYANIDKFIIYDDKSLGYIVCLNIKNFGIREVEKAVRLGGTIEEDE